MKKVSRNFSVDAEDADQLNRLVADSDAENASQWLRKVIRVLGQHKGDYAVNDISIARKK